MVDLVRCEELISRLGVAGALSASAGLDPDEQLVLQAVVAILTMKGMRAVVSEAHRRRSSDPSVQALAILAYGSHRLDRLRPLRRLRRARVRRRRLQEIVEGSPDVLFPQLLALAVEMGGSWCGLLPPRRASVAEMARRVERLSSIQPGSQPGSFLARIYLAYSRLVARRPEEALALVAEGCPDAPLVDSVRMRALLQLGRIDEAVDAYRRRNRGAGVRDFGQIVALHARYGRIAYWSFAACLFAAMYLGAGASLVAASVGSVGLLAIGWIDRHVFRVPRALLVFVPLLALVWAVVMWRLGHS